MIKDRNRLYKNVLVVIVLTGIMFILAICTSSTNICASVIRVEKREDTSDKAKIIVDGKDVKKVGIDFFVYTNGSGNTKDKKIKFKENRKTGKLEAVYNMKKGEYGTYSLRVTLYDEMKDYVNSGKVTFQYKSNIKDSISVVKTNSAVTLDMGKFLNQFYMISQGSGSERYFKTGTRIEVKVLYRSKTKTINRSQVFLMWGAKKIQPAQIENEGYLTEAGYYNCGAKYILDTGTDFNGELVTYYEETKGKFGKTSLGVKIYIDGTAPKIFCDQELLKGDTKYYNKRITFPITIAEKNFDDSNTNVFVNGKKVNVSWEKNGKNNQTKIKLSLGKNKITVNSMDKSGNKSKDFEIPEIVIDKKSPKVKIQGVENETGKGRVNGEYVKIPIKITVSDDVKLGNESIHLYRYDESDKVTEINLIRTGNDKVAEYYIDDLSDDGYYKLSICVSDKAGNYVNEKGVDYEGENPYNVLKKAVSGEFVVDRAGSLYVPENNSVFEGPIADVEDIVIYEYNKNEINEQSVTIIDSITSRTLSKDQYSFEKMNSSDRTEYKNQYKYTIYKSNLVEGYYNIKIHSKSIAGDNNSMTAITEESDNLNKQIVIDKTKPKVVSFYGSLNGEIHIKIRDYNLDETSVYLEINDEKIELEKDKGNSTSTNVIYRCNIGKNPVGAKVVYKDLAGNYGESDEIQMEEEKHISILRNQVMIELGGVILTCVIIVIIIILQKKNSRKDVKKIREE